MLASGAQVTLIPERLAEGVELGEITHVRGVGSEFEAYEADIQIVAGPVNKIVRAVIVPDMYTHRPLIGMDISPEDMFKAIEHVMSLQKSEQVRAVTTRSQSKKEEEAELVVEQTRLSEQIFIRNPEQITQATSGEMHGESIAQEAGVGNAGRVANESVQENEMEVEETKGEEKREGEVRVIEEASEEAGNQIPLAELGGSLAAEYKVAVMEDQGLEKWRVNADQSVNGFKWDQGLLKKLIENVIRGNREVLVVSVFFRHRMLQLVHDQLGHVGTGKMLWALKRHCTWPGISGTVKAYVKGCLECQRMRKGNAGKIPMGEMPTHDIPFNNVVVDIVGPSPRAKGFKFLLTYICLASRYPEAIPMKSATAAECLMEIFSRNGIPRTILSDQGSQFMGILVKGLCKRLGISQIRTTSYHPESNGSVERFHGTLVPILRKVSSKHLPWPDQVKFALYAVRSTPNRSTGYEPFEIVHGRNLRYPLEVVLEEIEPASNKNARASEWLHQLQERTKIIREEVRKNLSIAQGVRKEEHDKKCVSRSFKVEDMVLVRIPGLQNKLEGCWEGPFEVLAVPSEFHVVISDVDKTRRKKQGKRVHVNT